MKYTPSQCAISSLLLDPNNYRFLDQEDYRVVNEARYHEASVQEKAYQYLRGKRPEELQTLKESILANGYVPLEQLVVRSYEHKEGLFVIIEGNRRVAAMKWILKDVDSGIEPPEELIESFNKLPTIIIDMDDPENSDAVHVLMGIRHVSGVRAWGAYQQAKLVSQLMDDFSLSLQQTAAKITMTPQEAQRRRRAYKALKQMQEDEEFGNVADPELYYKFHSAVGIPIVRDWLGWSENELRFTNGETRRQFYELITEGYDDETSRLIPTKLKTRDDVASLRRILPDEDAKAALLDPSRPLSEATAIVLAIEGIGWIPKIRAAIKALENMTHKDMKSISKKDRESDMKLLIDLHNMLGDVIKDISKLSK